MPRCEPGQVLPSHSRQQGRWTIGPSSDNHADQASRKEALRRRVLGLVSGGVLSAAIGWGLNGGWQWFKLLGVPIRSGPGSFPLTSVVAYGLAGIAWGWVIAWPQKWQLSRLARGVRITILIVLLLGLLLVVAGLMVLFGRWIQVRNVAG